MKRVLTFSLIIYLLAAGTDLGAATGTNTGFRYMRASSDTIPAGDAQPCPGTPTVTDYDGNVYNTVKIGEQCWMKENLRVTHYADGVSIPIGNETKSYTDPYYYDYSSSGIPLIERGYLYNWSAAMHGANSSNSNPSGVQGACPTGWHVPSHAEWVQLMNYMNNVSAYWCNGNSSNIGKALAATTWWNNNNGDCTVGNAPSLNNATGLSAVPAGYCVGTTLYNNAHYEALFHSSTEYASSTAYRHHVYYNSTDLGQQVDGKAVGYSVRCLLGSGSNPPAVTTSAASSINTTSATCGGNITSDGSASIIARGVCWSTSHNPTTADSHTDDGTGSGEFTSYITGLEHGTTYYVRAYATNNMGTAYGQEACFTSECQTYFLSDDFNDGFIDSNKWTYTGNAVLEEDGQLKLQQNVTDQDVYLRTVNMLPPASGKVAMDRRFMLHRSNNYFGGHSCFYLNGGTDGNNFVGIQYEHNANNGWYGTYLVYKLDGMANGNRIWLCDATFDTWVAEHVELDFETGTLSYYVDTLVATVSIPEISNLTVDYYNVEFRPYGWWTGHQHYIDWVNIYGDVNVVTTSPVSDIATFSATCGGNITSDGCSISTDRGVCWSTSQSPSISDTHTCDGSGTGEFTSTLLGLTPGTTYYVRAYATNGVGTAYGNEISFTTPSIPSGDAQPCTGHETVTDYDGNVYNTVKIGQQCWMKENLRTTHYEDGVEIPLGSINQLHGICRYYPNGDESNVNTYGYLYRWEAVMYNAPSSDANPSGIQGVCPTGWHVPSDAEWTQLTDYMNSVPAYRCGNNGNIAKAISATEGWDISGTSFTPGNNMSTNNASGFNAMPAGYFRAAYNYIYEGFGTTAEFWSSTKFGIHAAYRSISYNAPNVGRSAVWNFTRTTRCILGDGANLPGVATDTISNVGITSVTCGGNVTTDGGSNVTARGVCWNTAPNPTLDNSHTTNGTGTGMFTSEITGLQHNTTYYIRAYATNAIGTVYGDEVSVTTLSFPVGACPESVTDYDGNLYNTVQIGQQCWMKENVRTTHYADGTAILLSDSTSSYDVAYRYNPDNNPSNVVMYGYLYNWAAVMRGMSSCGTNPSNVQGVCPTGWHMPSEAEWVQLTDYVRGVSAYRCNGYIHYIAKSLADSIGWNSSDYTCAVGNDLSQNNITDFSALPAGLYDYNSSHLGFSNGANLWSATQYYNGSFAQSWNLVYDNNSASINHTVRLNGLSVRCLLGAGTPLPMVTTDTIVQIGANTAIIIGTVSSDNSDSVTTRGVCWSTSPDPTTNDAHTSDGTGTGEFNSSITGLEPSTTYYVRAYATNSVGTAYGNEVSFTTLDEISCDAFDVRILGDTAGCATDSVTLYAMVPGATPPVAVGDILCTDNTIVKPGDWPVAGKTALGVVFHVDASGLHGWAVHLNDQSTSNSWGGYGTDIPNLPNFGSPREALADTAGYANTQTIRAYGDAAAYPAAWAVDFDNGWYLPAARQLRSLYGELPTLNTSLQTVGGTQFPMSGSWYYWSSTERSSYYAWNLHRNGNLGYDHKSIHYKIRSVRAF